MKTVFDALGTLFIILLPLACVGLGTCVFFLVCLIRYLMGV